MGRLGSPWNSRFLGGGVLRQAWRERQRRGLLYCGQRDPSFSLVRDLVGHAHAHTTLCSTEEVILVGWWSVRPSTPLSR